jgi:hypothetical protein
MTPRFAPSLAFPLVALLAGPARSQTFGANFAADYSFVDLGSPSGIPNLLGGVVFKPGDTNTLWIGGNATWSGGAIYEISVQRDAPGHIVAFSGTATLRAAAPYIDGGLVFEPTGDLFFTGYPGNTMGEFLPGSTIVNKTVNLTPAGVAPSVGGITFVPPGFAGAGKFKILSFDAHEWYEAQLTPDGSGTYDVTNVQLKATIGFGPEGAVYVHRGNPDFSADSVLVCEYGMGSVGAYNLDSNGDPIPATRQNFLTSQPDGPEGALIDPVTGDFILTTYGGGDRVLVVRGFTMPSVYCTAKTNSLGCVPSIGYTGLPRMSGPDDFHVNASNVYNRKFGLAYWGLANANTPFHGGTLCVASPQRFGPPSNSGGAAPPVNDCSGSCSAFFSQSFLTTHGLTPGTAGYVQFVMRDPGFAPPDGVALTDALRFVVGN